MYGLVVLIAIAFYIPFLIWCVRAGVRMFSESVDKSVRWNSIKGGGVGLVVGLFPFWDFPPMWITHQYYCLTDPPKVIVHEAAESWAARHEASLESLRIRSNERQSFRSPERRRVGWDSTIYVNRIVVIEQRWKPVGIVPGIRVERFERRVHDREEDRVLAEFHSYTSRSAFSSRWDPDAIRIWMKSSGCSASVQAPFDRITSSFFELLE